MSWAAIKVFAPYIAGALMLAALGALVLDRNHLAKLNNAHQACMAAIAGKPWAKPFDVACEPAMAVAAERAAASAACDHALTTGDAFAASQACTGPTKRVIADRDSQASEAANLRGQLDRATVDRDAAVTRAAARAKASVQGSVHAQAILAAAPVGGDGLSVCDADCLRQLAAP